MLVFRLHAEAEQQKTFEFGVDLVDYERTWSATNGWTYTISVAVLQRIPGHGGDIFKVGDPCIIIDRYIGDTVTSRIISYNICLDDPTQDTVTIGKFAIDAASNAVATAVKVNNSVQCGAAYNNNVLSHSEGIVSTSDDGLSRTVSAGTSGHLIQYKVSGNWVTVLELFKDSGNSGKITAYNLNHTQKIEMGGTYGLTIWKYSGAHGCRRAAWI